MVPVIMTSPVRHEDGASWRQVYRETQDLFRNSSDSFTFRNLLTTFGLIFFALQVTRASIADRYCTEGARRVRMTGVPSFQPHYGVRGLVIQRWVHDVLFCDGDRGRKSKDMSR